MSDLPKLTDRTQRLCVGAWLLLTAACFDAGAAPTGPDDALLHVVSRIECVGSTVTRSIACAPIAGTNTVVQDDALGVTVVP